jgi:hypothetical protein
METKDQSACSDVTKPGVFLWRNALERRSGNYFLEGRKPEWRSGTFYSGIPLRWNFGSLCAPEPSSKEK